MSRHDFTNFGAFPGAFVFTAPNVGNFLTASAIGNCEASVYVVLVSRMSLCRIIAIAMRAGTPARARYHRQGVPQRVKVSDPALLILVRNPGGFQIFAEFFDAGHPLKNRVRALVVRPD